ncbi:MAG: hypothetical protein GF317_13280 [Candidatus Lokiarchaeota archaeon]|nr:hypothetical protein [Candidatus Lokiarchaeota archaeon]MBD3200609.1 hypothetical protein [Candidatus Lokiarchaeota archaeon]
MARLAIGIVVGVLLSFISVSLFDMWSTFVLAETISQYNILKAMSTLIGANFEFDIITFFTSGPYTLPNFFQPALLSCIFLGIISGAIAKGLKRGTMASFLVITISILIWILISIVSGEDLMALFQGAQLISTVGGILGALIAGILGGLLGGLISGPYEESIIDYDLEDF